MNSTRPTTPKFKKSASSVQSSNTQFSVNYNQQLFLDYLGLYTRYRSRPKTLFEETVGAVKNFGEIVISSVSGNDPVPAQLQRIVRLVEARISSVKNTDDQFELIKFVREQAEIAKGLKIKNDDSKLYQTLHGLAGLMVVEFTDHCPEFAKQLKELQTSRINLAKKIKDRIANNRGANVKELHDSLNMVLVQLAKLGDVECANEAYQRKLLGSQILASQFEFDLFNCSSEGNEAGL